MYTSDWIENTGVMPMYLTEDVKLEVMYTDGYTTIGYDYDDQELWQLEGDTTDIDVYRYIYAGTSVEEQEDKADNEYNKRKEEGYYD